VLRSREGEGRRTPVIAMTAGVLDSDRERCLAAGMDDFVAKPVDVGVLSATLDRWVPRASAAPSLDVDRLDALRAVGPADGWGLLPTVVRAFLGAADGHLDRLRAAAAADDREALRREAHTLAGAAANLGAEGVVEMCRRLEGQENTGRGRSIGVLEGRLADARGELEALLGSRDREDPAS
jgi:HPt (histidine-containing phosphotransfer) domain-containing protein